MTTQERGEGRSSGKGLETRLQAEDDGELWSVPEQLDQTWIAETEPDQMDEASPANTPPDTPHALSARVYDEDSISMDAAEGVWGYLLPLNSKYRYGANIVLKPGNTSPIAKTNDSYETGKTQDADTNLFSTAGRYLIGRHPECDLHVEDPLVSNRHCLIFTENKNGRTIAIIEDLSSNGTFVNEAIVGRNKRRELKDRDEIIVLDRARFIFRYPKTIRESSIFSRKYTILQKIGKGHFSEVFSCVEKSTGQVYAVKVFTKNPGESVEPGGITKTDSLQQEIAIFMSIDHPNILYAKDTFDEQDAVYLVLELAPEGELFNLIVEKQKLSEEETHKIFLQIFQAVKYLHERGIVYRDIKPENILLMDKEDLTIKLMDFGLTKIIGEESFTTTLCGTPSYVAPEILADSRHRRYTRAVDIWSLGVVLYICLCGFPPFSDELYTKENPFTLADQIKARRFDYPSPYWDSVGDPALDLIDRMLTVDMEKRYTIDECLEHPWMQNKTASTSDTRSTSDSLVGGISSLNLSKRKVVRERTLLSSINDVKVTRVVEVGPLMDPVKVYVKDPNSKATISSGGNKRTGASVDDQFEPPAKLFRASADLGAERSHGISSSSPVLSELPLPSTWAFALDSEEGNPKGNQREPLGPKAKFGITMDYEENIYTTTIDKSHPDYKQRHKVAERKAREIERSVAAKLHVAEERTTDNLGEEDKHVSVRRQHPAPPAINESSFTASPKAKVTTANTPSSTSHTALPQVKSDGVPNATAIVERDVASAFKTFATQQRKNVELSRIARGRIEKETKLNDLKKFADSFKLYTPLPSDLAPIIAKDPAKQKEIQEKAKRNAKEAKSNPSEVSKPNNPAVEIGLGEFKKLQPLDVATKDKVAPETQSKDSMRVEQPSPGPELLSQNPQNILPSESSELISTQSYQAKSLLDSSDEASASTEATDVSSRDFNVTYSDDEEANSPLEEYDLGGRSLERRLIDPDGYFQELRDLEKELICNSGLAMVIQSMDITPQDPRSEVSKLRLDVPGHNDRMKGRNKTISSVLFRCQQILGYCCSNIERLQRAGFCGEYITVITEDRNRSSVAKLHKVPTKIIFDLQEKFLAKTRPQGVDVNLYRQIILSCIEVLYLMGIDTPVAFEYVHKSTFLLFTGEDVRMLGTLQATVRALDLSVVSYSGTHIRRFNQALNAAPPFFALTDTNYYDEEVVTPVICLRLRRLMCMDAFLGDCEVWVFRKGDDVSRNEPLWLSTGIEELNNIWGPCWKLMRDKEHGEIQSIEIGNGCILPWSGPQPEDNLSSFPPIDGNEVYSHWISFKDWGDAVVQRGQQGLERKYFSEDSTFLIGASPYTGLAVNPSCKPSKADLVWKKTRLEEKNALRMPKTSYARRFKDSHSYQITANIPIAGSHTQALSYKRQEGLDRKSALVERWRNNSGNPGELEDFSGVEVSICTQNACRMRLLSILGSDTMRDYLHGISFAWPTKRFESDYFQAMKSRRKFRKFWNRHLSFSNNISSAISICLDILQTTGVNNDNGELGALWVAEFEDEKYQDYSDDDESDDDMSDARSDSANRRAAFTEVVETRMPFKKVEEVIVALFRSEYTWTGFLRDSPETITMAIVTSSCLEATDDCALGRRCKRGWWEDGKYITVRGFPVIQTSLFVNEAILESSQLVSEQVPGRSRGCSSCRVWNTEGLQERSRFSLGDHGTLEVTVLPTKCCPVTIMAWADVKSSTWNEMKEVGFNEQLLGRSREPHHKEHISGAWETQPLPVLIMSKSKKETIL